MLSQNNIRRIAGDKKHPFNVIEAFAILSPKRKVLLCDSLFSGSQSMFRNSVKLLWPETQPIDIKKLEKFLMLLQKTAY